MDYLFTSERLGFRLWTDDDRDPFAALNADPTVRRYFPDVMSQEESDAAIDRFLAHYRKHGFCPYAVDELSSRELIGLIGFYRPTFEASFTPCIEIGWRLAQAYWGQGFATEGAQRCLEYAQEELCLDQIYSFTTVNNLPSERVMQRIGMSKISTFEHPSLPEGHTLRPHVLYHISLDQ